MSHRRLISMLLVVVLAACAEPDDGAATAAFEPGTAHTVTLRSGQRITVTPSTNITSHQHRVCAAATPSDESLCLGPFSDHDALLEASARQIGGDVLIMAVVGADIASIEGLDSTPVDLGPGLDGRGLLAVAPDANAGRVCFTAVTVTGRRIGAEVVLDTSAGDIRPECSVDE